MPRIYMDENLQYSPQDMNRRKNTLHAARLIVNASERSQVWVTTHSQLLAEAIREESGVSPVVLGLRDGETVIE